MKKTLLILCIILLTSCSAPDDAQDISSVASPSATPTLTAEAAETKVPRNELPESQIRIDMYYPLIEFYHPSDTHLKAWEESMLRKYSVDFNLTYTKRRIIMEGEDYSTIIGDEYDDIAELSGISGLVYINETDVLKDLIDNGYIKSLNQLIKDVDALSSVSDSALQKVTDDAGNVWAFPLVDFRFYEARTYSHTWLQAIGRDVPITVDEFYDYARAIATEDPDGNGLQDSCAALFTPDSVLSDFQDVFRAFGCYTDGSAVTYNPKSMVFENVILGKGFTECMEYISDMLQNGYIRLQNHPDHMEGSYTQTAVDYYPGSVYGKTAGLMTYEGPVKFGPYLEALNDTALIPDKSPVSCIAVLRDSEDEDTLSMMNGLYSIIGQNPGSYYDFKEGAEGYKYFDEGDYVNVISNDENGNTILPLYILTGFYDEDKVLKPAVFDGNTNQLEIMETENRHMADAAYELTDIELNNLFYSVPFDFISSEIADINMTISEVTAKLFRDIFENGIAIEDAVEQYKVELDLLGVIDELQEINLGGIDPS